MIYTPLCPFFSTNACLLMLKQIFVQFFVFEARLNATPRTFHAVSPPNPCSYIDDIG